MQLRAITPNPNKKKKEVKKKKFVFKFLLVHIQLHSPKLRHSVVGMRVTSAAPQSVHCLATLLRFSTSRPFSASRTPSLANRTLVPAPMPELAPVIRATFPLSEDT